MQNRFADHPLNDRQRLVLVYLRHHEVINNGDYRRLTRVDSSAVAGQELRGLVESGLVIQQNVGRWTTNRLNVPGDEAVRPEPELEAESGEARIIARVRDGGISNKECRDLLRIQANRAHYLLTKLTRVGQLKTLGEKKARRYVLP